MKRSVWQQYGTDAAGATVLALIVLGGYTLLVHTSLCHVLRAEPVRRQHSGMQATMAALREQFGGEPVAKTTGQVD